MVNRIVLNNISYHGKGAIQEIVNEVKTNGSALVCCNRPGSAEIRCDSKGDRYSGQRRHCIHGLLEDQAQSHHPECAGGCSGFSGVRSGCHCCHRRRLFYGYRKGDRHYHYQSGICGCAFSGGRCADEESRCSHHCSSHNSRYSSRGNHQLRYHRCRKKT